MAGNITNNAALIYNRADNFTYSGVISGSGTLEKKGTGTMTLTSNHPLSGTTTIRAGTLQLGNGGAGGGVAGNITNNAALIYNRADNFTYSGVISGTGTLEKKGSGTMTLTGNHPFSGTTTIRAGTLQLGNGGVGGGLTGNITDNAALSFNHADNFTYSGLLDGNGILTKLGGGIMTLTAANSFAGSVVIGNGTLALTGDGQLPASILNEATLEISGVTSHSIPIITGAGTTRVLAGATLTASSITQGTLIIGGASTAVPEPSVWLLLAIGFLGIVGGKQAFSGNILRRVSKSLHAVWRS